MRPSFETIYMKLAWAMSERSTCRRLSVGCAITSWDFRRVIAVGYNGNASKLQNDCDSDTPGACGCFVEGTLVFPGGLTHAYKRRYTGDVIRVITTAGEFTVTPNHPILTSGVGWVAAELLEKGNYLIGAGGSERVPAMAPNDQNGIPIEKVFETLAVTEVVVRRTGARHQFHGDGVLDEDVNVVSVDGSLCTCGESSCFDDVQEPPLPTANEVFPRLCCTSKGDGARPRTDWESTRVKEAPAHNDSANPISISEALSRDTGCIKVQELIDWKVDHALALVPSEVLSGLSKDTRLSEAVLNRRMGDLGALSDLENSLSVAVSLHEVLHVERYSWSGHVYNLGTTQGWYCLGTGGIIAHNCLHAEENACINCTASRDEPKVVFCTHLPCKMCAKRLVNLGGVVRVFYDRDYRLRDGLEILRAAGIEAVQLEIGTHGPERNTTTAAGESCQCHPTSR